MEENINMIPSFFRIVTICIIVTECFLLNLYLKLT